MKKWAILLLGMAASLASLAADIVDFPSVESESYLLYQGEIQQGDLEKLTNAHNKLEFKKNTTLLLHSSGGDVAEAMRIGEYLDANNISVTVWVGPPFGKMNCLSSCVLILAGGYNKKPLGRIGIHRPYITDMQINPKKSKENLAAIKSRIGKYLEEKGVSQQLAEDMFSTPPENIKILSTEEIKRYRLDQINYSKQEEEDIDMAKTMGWSREELMRRRARWSKECNSTETSVVRACVRAIMLEPISGKND